MSCIGSIVFRLELSSDPSPPDHHSRAPSRARHAPEARRQGAHEGCHQACRRAEEAQGVCAHLGCSALHAPRPAPRAGASSTAPRTSCIARRAVGPGRAWARGRACRHSVQTVGSPARRAPRALQRLFGRRALSSLFATARAALRGTARRSGRRARPCADARWRCSAQRSAAPPRPAALHAPLTCHLLMELWRAHQSPICPGASARG